MCLRFICKESVENHFIHRCPVLAVIYLACEDCILKMTTVWWLKLYYIVVHSCTYTTRHFKQKRLWTMFYFQLECITPCMLIFWHKIVSVCIYIYMTGQKGAHARGSALQLKIKHFWKLFLFEMLCTCMNEWIYSPDNFSNQTGWFQDLVVARWKWHRKNRYPCVEWFWSLSLKRNRKHVE